MVGLEFCSTSFGAPGLRKGCKAYLRLTFKSMRLSDCFALINCVSFCAYLVEGVNLIQGSLFWFG
jgi:hypothetical protein